MKPYELISVLLVVLVIGWIFLPFAISGISRKLSKLVSLVEENNRLIGKLVDPKVVSAGGSPAPGDVDIDLVENLIHKGNLSAAGIASGLNIDEVSVRRACDVLIKQGRISPRECHRVTANF
jgi:hypothetical protein